MKTKYEVKSRAKAFGSFCIIDNGLGYLTFNIYWTISEVVRGPIGRIIGLPREYPESDIAVRKVGTKKWKSIKYKRNSSENYLK